MKIIRDMRNTRAMSGRRVGRPGFAGASRVKEDHE